MTADFLGTDAGGHTSWVVGVGKPSGTLTQSISVTTSALCELCFFTIYAMFPYLRFFPRPFLRLLSLLTRRYLLLPVTLVADATEAHVTAALGGTTLREDCVIGTATFSDGAPVAACTLVIADATSTDSSVASQTGLLSEVQVGAKNAAAGLGLKGIAVSALVAVGAAGVLLAQL